LGIKTRKVELMEGSIVPELRAFKTACLTVPLHNRPVLLKKKTKKEKKEKLVFIFLYNFL
jgi:hypothetical protein